MVDKKHDLTRLIASRASAADYFALGHYLPNPDPVLKKMGKDIAAYREVLSDSHVSGCSRRRKVAVAGLNWRITPTEDEKTNEILTALFDALPLSKIINQILNATLFGYQVLEVMWAKQGEGENALLLPVAIEGKPPEWFVFDDENCLRYRTKNASLYGECVQACKFLVATQEASYENPYGQGDLAKCFWAATFKKGGFKFWLEFTEKYGSPWLLGKHPRTASPTETEDLLDSLEQMLGTAVAAIPNDSSIEILESESKGGSSQVFDDFLRYCKSEISVAILGQDQTTEADSNRASSQSGLEVLKSIRDGDVEMVETVFNTLLKWICDYNFHLETLPKFELFEQESIDKLQAERDSMLANMGVKFTEQYFNRTYNFEEGDIVLETAQVDEKTPQSEIDKTVSEKSAEFAESKADKLETIADSIIDQLAVEADPVVENWLQGVKDKLAQAESLEDFQSQLEALIPELSFSEYGELLAMGSTVAELAGRQAVIDESLVKQPAKG